MLLHPRVSTTPSFAIVEYLICPLPAAARNKAAADFVYILRADKSYSLSRQSGARPPLSIMPIIRKRYNAHQRYIQLQPRVATNRMYNKPSVAEITEANKIDVFALCRCSGCASNPSVAINRDIVKPTPAISETPMTW